MVATILEMYGYLFRALIKNKAKEIGYSSPGRDDHVVLKNMNKIFSTVYVQIVQELYMMALHCILFCMFII